MRFFNDSIPMKGLQVNVRGKRSLTGNGVSIYLLPPFCKPLQGGGLAGRRCVISIVYLIRHGETDWNREKRIQGGIDIPLNERGRQQAEALAGRLASLALEKIFTSDLGRAQETTARVVARQPAKEIPVVATPALREGSYGLWEGLTRQEVIARFAGDWEGWVRRGGSGSPPEGEDFATLAKRVGGVFDAAAGENETVLISTHHGPIQAILCHALGIGLSFRSRFLVLNCSLSALECLPGHPPRLILLNDTSHLNGGSLPSGHRTAQSW